MYTVLPDHFESDTAEKKDWRDGLRERRKYTRSFRHAQLDVSGVFLRERLLVVSVVELSDQEDNGTLRAADRQHAAYKSQTAPRVQPTHPPGRDTVVAAVLAPPPPLSPPPPPAVAPPPPFQALGAGVPASAAAEGGRSELLAAIQARCQD